MRRRVSALFLCSIFLASFSIIPTVKGTTPGYGDFLITSSSEPQYPMNFSAHGFFITSDSGCGYNSNMFAGGTKYICDYESRELNYNYSWYTYLAPIMYNETILLINGEQGRPDFGEQNHIYGINIESWTIQFTINSPWNDGWVVNSAVISPNGEYVAFSRGSCVQIWNMKTLSNSKLFADYQGSSSSYCSGVASTLVSVFSSDSSIYVGYEPGESNTISAYSTDSWSKLGTVQSLSSDDSTAKDFIFSSDGMYAYYVERGGWDDDNKRIKNKIFRIDISDISNLWNQSTHTEFFFGPTELDSSTNRFSTFSNQDLVGSSGENRVEIESIRSIDEYDAILLWISADSSSRAFPHNGVVLLSSSGYVLGELIGGDVSTVDVEYLDSDGDGTPNFLDGAPWDSGDTVDSDGDGVGDSNDAFPYNPNQTTDRDGDGYGDRPNINEYDIFPDDPTQWSDFDRDGYGDNLSGNNPDMFPENPNQWNDSDGDGYGDNRWGDRIDFFPDNPLRWSDLDRDGIADEDDHCPEVIGFIDIDGDGYCEVEDDDDDGDGFEDLMEYACGTNASVASSFPPDIDGDYICDDQDSDIDGDNVSNEEDIFPLDATEWNDLDSDGVGNNSDECVGNYGTSTIDRLGCLDQDGDGVSDLNDIDPYNADVGVKEYMHSGVDANDHALSGDTDTVASIWAISGVIMSLACVIIIVKRVRSTSDDSDEDKFVNKENFGGGEDEPATEDGNELVPNFSLKGEPHESGYEVLEYPSGSNKWWWKDEENHFWMPWD